MKKLLLILLCLPMIGFGQDEEIETSKSKKISFDGKAGIGLGFVQDRNSPKGYGKLGIVNDFFKLYIVGSSDYFFSTRSDDSRKVAIDQYAGIEWLMPSSSWGTTDRDDDRWGGIGFSYCFENQSKLHNKQPVKAYVVYCFGIISVNAGYVWSDFSYPAISVSFEY
jgi:hypothetical protein